MKIIANFVANGTLIKCVKNRNCGNIPETLVGIWKVQSRIKKHIEMRKINLTISLGKIFLILSLFLFGMQYGYGQERENKINTLIDTLRIIETQKWKLEIRLQPLKYEVTKEDSIKLIEIENLMTDQEIKKRIFLAFEELFTDNEIKELYNIITSPVLHKYMLLLESGLDNQFQDIESKLDIIAQNYKKHESTPKFEPIPVNREDGFYATIDYDPNRKDFTLEESPAITKKDILEVQRGTDNSSVDITFNNEGSRKFYLLTKDNIGLPIAIVIDKYVVSMPKVWSAISGGTAIIGGNFTEEEVENMIRRLSNE